MENVVLSWILLLTNVFGQNKKQYYPQVGKEILLRWVISRKRTSFSWLLGTLKMLHDASVIPGKKLPEEHLHHAGTDRYLFLKFYLYIQPVSQIFWVRIIVWMNSAPLWLVRSKTNIFSWTTNNFTAERTQLSVKYRQRDKECNEEINASFWKMQLQIVQAWWGKFHRLWLIHLELILTKVEMNLTKNGS